MDINGANTVRIDANDDAVFKLVLATVNVTDPLETLTLGDFTLGALV